MDDKDWLLVLAALVIFGGPVGHVIWRRSRGRVVESPDAGLGERYLITDPVRVGTAITSYGGKAFAEEAKLLKTGAGRYTARQEAKAQQLVGGQAS